MNDKERILMVIITRIIPGLAYCCHDIKDRDKYIESDMLKGIKLEKGDLVYANTSIYPNDFCVGFVERVQFDSVLIREIGSNRMCNYYNESFTKINKERLGYEVLEGLQYKIYKKVLKAFSEYAGYCDRFHSMSFEDGKCIVNWRKTFKDTIAGTTEFKFNSKTTIKFIGNLLETELDNKK